MATPHRDADDIPTLPERMPVTMPELPARLVISTAEQFKAIAEPTRTRILGIIQSQPATAKQIADRLQIAPGAAGHHLQTLEAAGLAQVVAKRLVRGIVAKYYARTARIFAYDVPPEVTGGLSPTMEIMTTAANELAETIAEAGAATAPETTSNAGQRCGDNHDLHMSFPHARMSPERAKVFKERLSAIVEDLIHEPNDPNGTVYGMCVALFRSPRYMQSGPPTDASDQAGDQAARDRAHTDWAEGDQA